MRRLLTAAVLVLALATPALGHGTHSASYHGCGRISHPMQYDFTSSLGWVWYHQSGWGTGPFPYSFTMTTYHYTRSGPPSNPVYTYQHKDQWKCF